MEVEINVEKEMNAERIQIEENFWDRVENSEDLR